jgi:hypothetical protein
MGRGEKRIGSASGIDRRDSGYYATPAFIAEYLAERLTQVLPQGRLALDPCVGRGELAIPLIQRGVRVDGLDILRFDLPDAVRFRQEDFLEFYEDARRRRPLPYDYYVANPPYNCHEVSYIRQNKPALRRRFPEVGVHNMYSMFLSAMIDCAKDGAALAILTLDSFLTSRAHEPLRRQILETCTIHSLLLCPTDLFLRQKADVRTCILILQKGRQYQREIQVANRARDAAEFRRFLETETGSPVTREQLILSGEEDRAEFVVGVPRDVRTLFSAPRVGNRFDCVTGISTGNDARYLRDQKTAGFSVPFYKNPGSRKFFAPPNGFLADDYLAISRREPNFIVRNRTLLGRPGLTCSSMGVAFGACYRPERAMCGVNANIMLPDESAWWLMAYLNSRLVTYLVRGVLLRGNMITSGYVARIPLPELSPPIRRRLDAIARAAHADRGHPQRTDGFVGDIDRLLQAELGLRDPTAEMLAAFSSELLRRA